MMELGTAYNHGDIVQYVILQPHTSVPTVSPEFWSILHGHQQSQPQGSSIKCRHDATAHCLMDTNASPPQQSAIINDLKKKSEDHVPMSYSKNKTELPHSLAQPRNRYLDWNVFIEFDSGELGCNLSVLIFIGEVPEDTEEWLCCECFVGALCAYIDRSPGHVELTQGPVHLNSAIIQHSGVRSLEPSVVVPFLEQTLQWRVIKASDDTPAQLDSLQGNVVCRHMRYPSEGIFRVCEKLVYYNGITHGQPGAASLEKPQHDEQSIVPRAKNCNIQLFCNYIEKQFLLIASSRWPGEPYAPCVDISVSYLKVSEI
ncbi:hypothetical protein CPB85DRAFT_1438675 [Mucidula mucida]|nr:hypothetical protein CPB85DRAFT_1438675 [Mucidula mucida]